MHRNKTDTADTDALGQRQSRPRTQPVTTKSIDQQAMQSVQINTFFASINQLLPKTPREYSSGNKQVMGRISKRGDKYLRMLLIHGAHRKRVNGKPVTRLQQWATDIQQQKHHNIANVALANKMAKIVWAMWTKGDDYKAN